MRVVALDYGAARCGVAVSDPSGTLATPREPVLRPATKRGFAALLALIEELEAERVIVGLPLSLSGGDSAQTDRDARVRRAAGERAIEFRWSSTTSASPRRLASRRAEARRLDSRAAAVLLDEWLPRACR